MLHSVFNLNFNIFFFGINSIFSKYSSNASFKKEKSKDSSKTNPGPGYVIISGDYDGEIKVFLNAAKPKHSSLPWFLGFSKKLFKSTIKCVMIY